MLGRLARGQNQMVANRVIIIEIACGFGLRALGAHSFPRKKSDSAELARPRLRQRCAPNAPSGGRAAQRSADRWRRTTSQVFADRAKKFDLSWYHQPLYVAVRISILLRLYNIILTPPASMLKSDIAPAYRGGDVLRTRHISIVEIAQRAGNTQNAVKPPRAQFFRIGNAVEQALAGSVQGRQLISASPSRCALRQFCRAICTSRAAPTRAAMVALASPFSLPIISANGTGGTLTRTSNLSSKGPDRRPIYSCRQIGRR